MNQWDECANEKFAHDRSDKGPYFVGYAIGRGQAFDPSLTATVPRCRSYPAGLRVLIPERWRARPNRKEWRYKSMRDADKLHVRALDIEGHGFLPGSHQPGWCIDPLWVCGH